MKLTSLAAWRTLSFGQLLGAGLAVLVTLGAVSSILAHNYLTSIQRNVHLLANVPVDNLIYLLQLKDEASARAQIARDLILEVDPSRIEEMVTRQGNLARQAQGAIEQIESRLLDAQGAELVMRLRQARARYDPLLDRAVADAQGANAQEAVQALLRTHPAAQSDYLNVLNEMVALQQDQALSVGGDTETVVTNAVRAMVIMTAMSAVFGSAVAIVLLRMTRRHLGGDLGYAADVARRISQGDLSHPISLRKDDGTSLLAHVEIMRKSLATIVGQVRERSEAISAGARQLTVGNADLSERTEEQAANLEETAASMEQMTGTVRQNTDTVRMTSATAIAASEAAEAGGVAVLQAMRTMDDIKVGSRKIGDIVAIIESIAFQTNMLALNAAVGAARAGKQGRGFAVVAGEVRALAQRSAQAAKEITNLVQGSVELAERSGAIVDHAGAAIRDVVKQVHDLAQRIAEVGTASREQEQGISQVSLAVTQLDGVTQQNAALVEEASAAATMLHAQAEQLVRLVSTFRLAAR